MLQTLARHPRRIAWFLTGIFYLELVLVPAVTRAESGRTAYVPSYLLATGKPFTTGKLPIAAKPVPPAKKVTTKVAATAAQRKSPGNKQGAFTTGPTQPEMQSFQSVNSNNLVDLFTGDFSYNIPLLDVGGYPVNLHYQSGITMDQEASWVGLGWNINPGVISRNMRGVPDDFQGGADAIRKTVSMKPNRTIGVTLGANMELIGRTIKKGVENADGVIDSVKGRMGVLGSSLGVFHNTYKGWGTEVGLNVNINSGKAAQGGLSGGLSITNNSQSGLDISPSLGYHIGKNEKKTQGDLSIGTNYNSRTGIQNLQVTGEIKQHIGEEKKGKYSGLATGLNSQISFSRPSYTPTITVPFTSYQFGLTAKVGSEHWGFHPNGYLRGYSSVQKIETNDRSLNLPAYGYLYYDKAGNEKQVLLDFNREKDIAYSEETPHIAVPIYTYDTYSITGEGTGGMFRPYRGDIGYVFDHAMSTRSNSDKFSLDVGVGTVAHGGIDFNKVASVTRNNPWESDNAMRDAIAFRKRDSSFENVYFKNPGEKTSVNRQYLDAIGNDSLVRVDLSPLELQNEAVVFATRDLSLFKNARSVAKRTLQPNTLRTQRDKRTQVISFLTAEEAALVGLDKKINYYPENVFPGISCDNFQTIDRKQEGRKANHLSEITVLNPDGRRYIYGVPVYNRSQVEVSMSIKKTTNNTGLAPYSVGTENSVDNNTGKEGYFSKEEIPAYAHSFLLSGILSPDYVDITQDGITEDDNGDAVKFNYSRVYSFDDPYKWRAPYDEGKAFYNEGLKTDSRDERGSYTYGEREVWYLNSVESKTMIATFVLDTELRKDGYGVKNENGGRNTAQALKRLKEINLYTKADLLKNGTNAKPIKTVHFEYSYKLCQKNAGSVQDSGKLTLEKVWFTYNKNNKGRKNPYIFTYHGSNPDHNTKSVDRWGNFKQSTNNPGTAGNELVNADYSYALQEGVKSWNKDSADYNAAAWTLSQIQLPSGGKLKVTYEADDYSYVQNKRAMQFFPVEGFAATQSGTPGDRLYPFKTPNSDYRYAFVRVTEPVTDKADIQRKYLEGVQKLFFKLMVKMPDDPSGWGKGPEIIPCYADIEDYGVKPNTNNKVIWIRLGTITKNESPAATTAIQFLRLNLPSKAYPYSEPGDNFDLRGLLGMMASIGSNVSTTINGFANHARGKDWCSQLILDQSFARLDNPIYKKYGGGLRVKRVEIFDNWNKMTNQARQESVYGQDYDYTQFVDINGVPTRISSGVAVYEPAIGNDENPFRVPHKLYTQKVGALAPTDYMYSEEPFAETFFPTPMVGYSKVTVQTIHKTKKSANGFSETVFYTAKDFPVIVEYTPLDKESKKNYNPPIRNALQLDARHYVTLSQGFKVELNDMNGKLKSQASYAQTDLKTPISYTQNYYRLQSDNALQQKLSNKVAVVDSSNGVINYDGEIGKEVELMFDMREQSSTTISGSIEVNGDFVHPFPPITFFSKIPLPSKETNRYRAIAVLKVVNRYGILDSVTHIEKGSKITTRNILYDGETGDVLLSQTNNEFNDPIYNFNYPAHWAYSGMGPAYKNIGTVFSGKRFKEGRLYNSDNSVFNAVPYFESGDELLVSWRKKDAGSAICFPVFESAANPTRVWAIDGAKTLEKEKGIFFIDSAGRPFTGAADNLKIIRSGKRNMSGIAVGAVTSMQSPIRKVDGKDRLVLDSGSKAIATTAVSFKDSWKVENIRKLEDSCGVVWTLPKAKPDSIKLTMALQRRYASISTTVTDYSSNYAVAAYQKIGGGAKFMTRALIKPDLSGIPPNAIVTEAHMSFYGTPPINLFGPSHSPYSDPGFNYSYEGVDEQAIGWVFAYPEPWAGNEQVPWIENTNLNNLIGNRATLPFQSFQNICVDYLGVDSKDIIQDLIGKAPAYQNLMLKLDNDDRGPFSGVETRFMSFYHNNSSGGACSSTLCSGQCNMRLLVNYIYPEIKCYKVCRTQQLQNDTLNPYRYGILGNWRVDTAYTYYGERQQPDTSLTKNLRTDGAIRDFAPYWRFNDTCLKPVPDPERWVWNSKVNLFNSKGFEIENKDALNRYTAGLYGYNKTLPIAVAQNTRNREITFDGFEDGRYNTNDCIRCNENGWVPDSSSSVGYRTDLTSHTGKYSYRVLANQSVPTNVPIAAAETESPGPVISMPVDSIPIVNTVIVPKGTGLHARYGVYWANLFINPCLGTTIAKDDVQWYPQTNTLGVNIDYGAGGPWPFCATDYFVVEWTGVLQPKYTGTYVFSTSSDDGIELVVNGNSLVNYTGDGPKDFDFSGSPMVLQAGQLYPIKVVLWEKAGSSYMNVKWSRDGLPAENLPITSQYPSASDTAGSVLRDTTWCVNMKPVKPLNAVIDKFTPTEGQKMVVSAWVKEDIACVTGSNYENARIRITFNNGNPAIYTLKSAGPVIEGWQRIEEVITIPAGVSQMQFKLESAGSVSVLFDDVRLHPYNSNMKSFVYDPINIRLVSELDENNYATFYEYDDDGTLVRVKKETERGIKTIKETRSALIKK